MFGHFSVSEHADSNERNFISSTFWKFFSMMYDWPILQVRLFQSSKVVTKWLVWFFRFRTHWIEWKQFHFVYILKIFFLWCTTGPFCRSDFFEVQKWSESGCIMFGYFVVSEHADSNESNFISYIFWNFFSHHVRLANFAGPTFLKSKSGQKVVVKCLVIFPLQNTLIRIKAISFRAYFENFFPWCTTGPFCRSDFL